MVQQENIFSQLHYIEWWRGAEMVDLQIGERIVSAGHCDTQPHWENPQRHVHQQPAAYSTTTMREILDSELFWRQLLTIDRHLLDHVPNHCQLDKVGWCGLGTVKSWRWCCVVWIFVGTLFQPAQAEQLLCTLISCSACAGWKSVPTKIHTTQHHRQLFTV